MGEIKRMIHRHLFVFSVAVFGVLWQFAFLIRGWF